jgi:hypothetical protein
MDAVARRGILTVMKALVFLLTLACTGLSGFSLWQWLEHGRMKEELTELKEENTALAKTARTKASLAAGLEVKSKGPSGLEGIVPLEDEGLKDPARPKEDSPAEEKRSPFEQGLAKMLKSKDTQELIKAQAGAQLELQYRDLFDDMQLSPEKRDAVLAILKERLAAQMKDGMAFMDKEVSAEEKKAAAERLAAASRTSEEQLKQALGDTEYQTFDRYEKSQPEREQLKVLSSMLKDRKLALDDATETQLMDAMFNARQNFKFDSDLSNPATLSPEAMSEAGINRYVEQNTLLQKEIADKVKPILSPEQFEVFQQSQKSQAEAVRMGLEMFRGSGGGTDGKD